MAGLAALSRAVRPSWARRVLRRWRDHRRGGRRACRRVCPAREETLRLAPDDAHLRQSVVALEGDDRSGGVGVEEAGYRHAEQALQLAHRRAADAGAELAVAERLEARDVTAMRDLRRRQLRGRRRGRDRGAERLRANELRLDEDAVGRVVERVAGGQDEALAGTGNVLEGLAVARRHDPVTAHPVGEAAVRHLQRDLVARLEVVDLPEGRRVRGPVTRDPDRAALSGQCGVAVVVAGALLERAGVGALYEDVVHAELRDLDPAERLAGRHRRVEMLGEQRDALVRARVRVADSRERSLL